MRSRGCAFANAWAEIGATDHAAAESIRAEKARMLALFTQIASGDPTTGRLLQLLHEGAQVTATIRHDASVFDEACAASKEFLVRRRSIRTHA